MPQLTRRALTGAALTSSLASASCLGSATRAASPAPVTKSSQQTTTPFSEGGCSLLLSGAWKRLPTTKESGGYWQVEPADGSQMVSVLPMAIRKPGNAGEWREDLAAVVNLRRDADHETFGPDARFSEPEYHAHPSSPSATYSVYDPKERALQATLVKMTRSRYCLALLSEEGTEEEAFGVRARALLDALRVEP